MSRLGFVNTEISPSGIRADCIFLPSVGTHRTQAESRIRNHEVFEVVCSLLTFLEGCSSLGGLGADNREPAGGPRPYHRALVISGENINTPLFIGMADGSEDAEKMPM